MIGLFARHPVAANLFLIAGLFLGRWIDARFASGIFWSAPLMFLGICIGGWTAWKWMNAR